MVECLSKAIQVGLTQAGPIPYLDNYGGLYHRQPDTVAGTVMPTR
jgi:hypothetical protein